MVAIIVPLEGIFLGDGITYLEVYIFLNIYKRVQGSKLFCTTDKHERQFLNGQNLLIVKNRTFLWDLEGTVVLKLKQVSVF